MHLPPISPWPYHNPVLVGFAFGLRRALRRIRARLDALRATPGPDGDVRMGATVSKLLSYLDYLTAIVPKRLCPH